MAPFIATAPAMTERSLRLANPRTRTGIRLLHAGAGLAAGPVGRAMSRLTRGRTGQVAGDVPLPDYPDTTVAAGGPA
jgi:hypothetical protein